MRQALGKLAHTRTNSDCLLCFNISGDFLVMGLPTLIRILFIRKPLNSVRGFWWRGCSLKCVTQASCPLPRVRILLSPHPSWQCHSNNRDMAASDTHPISRHASSWRIRTPIMQIKSPTKWPMNGLLSRRYTMHFIRTHCCDSHLDGGDSGDMSCERVTMRRWWCNGSTQSPRSHQHVVTGLTMGQMTKQKI